MPLKPLTVSVEPASAQLFRLVISDGGARLGEYERSKEPDIERKKGEIERAADLLRWVHKTYGEFEVRWTRDCGEGRKEIRVGGRVVGIVPRICWGEPSWVAQRPSGEGD